MAPAARGGRALTILAVGFLVLDAALLAYAGLRTNRIILVIAAGILALMAWGVVLLWKRQQARLDEIGQVRAALKYEVSQLRSLVSQRRSGMAPPE